MLQQGLVVVCLWSALSVVVVSSSAAKRDCDKVLVPQVTISTLERAQQLAWLSIASYEEYVSESRRTNMNAIFPEFGFVGLDQDNFATRRMAYLSAQRFDYREVDRRSFFQQGFTKEQVQAWVGCMAEEETGVFLLVSNGANEDNRATLLVEYRGSPGREAKIKIDAVAGTIGKKKRSQVDLTLPDRGSRTFHIERKGKERSVFTANIPGGESTYTAAFPVPYVAPPVKATTVTPKPKLVTLTMLYSDLHQVRRFHLFDWQDSETDGWHIKTEPSIQVCAIQDESQAGPDPITLVRVGGSVARGLGSNLKLFHWVKASRLLNSENEGLLGWKTTNVRLYLPSDIPPDQGVDLVEIYYDHPDMFRNFALWPSNLALERDWKKREATVRFLKCRN